jgi:hypothetical protein
MLAPALAGATPDNRRSALSVGSQKLGSARVAFCGLTVRSIRFAFYSPCAGSVAQILLTPFAGSQVCN